VFDAAGCAAAQVGEGQMEGVAVAEVEAGQPAGAAPAAQLPWQVRAFAALLRPAARRAYARNRTSGA
jgi:hypothetical protein